MHLNRISISTGTLVDSQPPGRESPRNCCRGVSAGRSSLDCEPFCSLHSPGSLNEQGSYPRSTPPSIRSLRPSLSQSVRAGQAAGAASRAQTTTTTDHSLCAFDLRPKRPRAARSAAQSPRGRMNLAATGSRTTSERGNRPLLPQHPTPYPSSRTHEEGNVDQRVAAGGMPHRDR
jgi:hypothetical protein